jgi:adenylate kinase
VGRSDDNEETIRVRQHIYAEQTAPLLEVYGSRGLLVEVDGLGEIDEVSERVFAALDGTVASQPVGQGELIEDPS